MLTLVKILIWFFLISYLVKMIIRIIAPLVIRYYVASLGTIYLCLSSKTDPNKLKYDDMSDSDES